MSKIIFVKKKQKPISNKDIQKDVNQIFDIINVPIDELLNDDKKENKKCRIQTRR